MRAMTAATKSASAGGFPASMRPEWLLVLLGAASLYLPTYVSLASTIWRTEEQAHGPIVLAVALWLIWRKRAALTAGEARPKFVAGSMCLTLGLLFYVVGRSQDILILEVGSQIPVLAGTLLMMRGTAALRAAWFPLLYLAFMIPLPGFVVDALTGPLKQWVSAIAEHILYGVGYPVARDGVVLTVGQYQLLVADACSGLNSMFSLAALGLLFMYVTARKSLTHNAIMVLSILPIAFAANIVRVIVLVLVTYHAGDAAAQGIAHGSAGMILMIAALLFFTTLDWMLSRFTQPKTSGAAAT